MQVITPACGEMVVEDPLSRVGHTHTHRIRCLDIWKEMGDLLMSV